MVHTTRKAALAQGLTRYYGKICVKHAELQGERKVSSMNCVGCAREIFRRWNARNPEAQAARQREYRAAHPVPHRLDTQRYKLANPHKPRAWNAKRWAAKMQRIPKWLTADDFRVIELFYEAATCFTRETGVRYAVDHYYPLQGKTVSGLHVPQNLRVIPAAQNARKGNRHPAL